MGSLDWAFFRSNVEGTPQLPQNTWHAIVTKAPKHVAEKCHVAALFSADGGELDLGEASWFRAGASIPKRGDKCLVTLDDNGQPWITCWEKNEIGGAGGKEEEPFEPEATVPVDVTRPSITGGTKEGEMLTAHTGEWTNSPTSFTFQWKRNGVAITGAVGETYSLTPADVGHTITVSVIAHNIHGASEASESAATTTITEESHPGGVPVDSTVPTISGTIIKGNTLTAAHGSWTNTPSSYTYVWKRNGAAIAGATGETYVLALADVGAKIKVAVTAHNGSGASIPAESTETGTITEEEGVPVNQVLPTTTGAFVKGTIVTAVHGTWTNSPTSYTYQWYRETTAIAGATGETYLLAPADVGERVVVGVIAHNSHGPSLEAKSLLSPKVIEEETVPVYTSGLTITGADKKGQTLHAFHGSWTNTPSSYTYVWKRSGVTITGATGEEYTLVSADVGHVLTVVVTAHNIKGASAPQESSATGSIEEESSEELLPFGHATNGLGSAWEIKFDDEFPGTSLDKTKWGYGWYASNPESETEISEFGESPFIGTNMVVGSFPTSIGGKSTSGGKNGSGLIIKTEPHSGGGVTKTTGFINTSPSQGENAVHFAFTYGFVECRMWVPGNSSGETYNWPAMWMEGNLGGAGHVAHSPNSWPSVGEIDIYEGLEGNAESHWHGAANSSGGENEQGGGFLEHPGNAWHRYGVHWTSTKTIFFYDGVKVGECTPPYQIPEPMALMVSGGFGSFGGPLKLGAEATILCDYIRVWQEGSGATPVYSSGAEITGTDTKGSTLTAHHGTWANGPETYEYQWKRNGANITGATGETYTLVTADVGTKIKVAIKARNTHGTSAAHETAETETIVEGGGGGGGGGEEEPMFLFISMETYAEEIRGNTSQAPHLNARITKYGAASNVESRGNFSAPCYVEWVSGLDVHTVGSADYDEGIVHDEVDTSHNAKHTIFDQCHEAGYKWAEYVESESVEYRRPKAFFPHIEGWTESSESVGRSFASHMISDYNGEHPPRYAFLVPNNTHNMHSSSIATGDSWIHGILNELEATTAFTSSKLQIVIGWDGQDSYNGESLTGPAGIHCCYIVVSKHAEGAGLMTTTIKSVSILKSIEHGLGFGYLGHAADESRGLQGLLSPGL